MSILQDIAEKLQMGKSKAVAQLVAQALEEGEAPDVILDQGLIAGMDVVGEQFKNGDLFVPEVLIAARALSKGMEVLKPALQGAGVEPIGKAIICTVHGDMHDIGKNLVASMFEGSGFEVVNLGINVEADKFVQAIKENDADILVLSALLTTTMGYMKDVIEAVKAAGLRDKVKIMVGGAPVNADFAAQVEADVYTADANEAVLVAKKLLGKA